MQLIKSIVQIEGVEAAQLFGKLDGLSSEIANLKSQISGSKKPTDYLSRQQVAEMFGVSLVTVHDWTQKGILKAYKLANRVYFVRSQVEASLTEMEARKGGYHG